MSEFVEYLSEVFAEFGQTNVRHMFGGHGLYYDGIMFGLVADDQLYLKVDDTIRADYEALGLTAFEYNKNGKTMTMSYYHAPEEIYDDPEVAAAWAQKSWEIALKAQKKKKRP
ncbi:MAG: TfoX/Sxy family protein [Proteobacteria bacterium]|jgi:DNA transformation protein and related proteins|nr:TfoX/Sxy family protein [Pseudomonadota bacterium]